MAKTYLISIVSEQTLPNYLFIKEFQHQVDKFIFITTKQMEEKEKSDAIIETTNLSKNQFIKIVVEEDVVYKAKEKINKALLNASKQDFFLVNLTGGTKLMSITVFEYFKYFHNTRFFYVPIGTNTYKEIFLDKPAKEKNFTYNISLNEYFRIYSLDIEPKKDFIFDQSLAFKIFKRYRQTEFTQFPYQLFPSAKGHFFDANQKIAVWLEEFIYYYIKFYFDKYKEKNLGKEQIKTSVKLFNRKKEAHLPHLTDNEIDIAFIYKNNLYIIEVKKGLKSKVTENITNFLYKLAAINRNFGLRSRATLMTLTNIYTIPLRRQAVEDRCRLLNIYPPFEYRHFKNLKNFFNPHFENFIK